MRAATDLWKWSIWPLHKPAEYGKILHQASPMIDAFGSAFLIMIGLQLFHRLQQARALDATCRAEDGEGPGDSRKASVCIMLSVAAVLYFTVEPPHKALVLISAVLGIMLHIGLELFGSFFHEDDAKSVKIKTGWAAFASLLYLEVLDASFSFDGVIGAFAITNSVLLIVAGLGAGAIWVRSLTVYLLRTGALSKYKYLENGAHWAIMALGVMMIAKLFHLELPEWATGGLGLLFVSLAVGSSILEARSINLQEAAADKITSSRRAIEEQRFKNCAAKTTLESGLIFYTERLDSFVNKLLDQVN
ncbi:DUF475 domain-containing protein [Candidatus Minimicrobia naudis]|uniref:DUF475 domain-containing protein n=1 Tax=Candidatus Minimicrobia naudis TaxID=2841263 RepID=A0A8F1SC10_9BACT|nr:DUF475 domain-containing protein [Candidatus Minimicrobia naudis]